MRNRRARRRAPRGRIERVRFPRGPLDQLIGSTTRLRLLSLFLRFPTRQFFGFELAGLTQSRPWAVQRELRQFEQVELLTRTAGRYRVFYQVNRSFPLLPELVQLFRKAQLPSNAKIAKKFGNHGSSRRRR